MLIVINGANETYMVKDHGSKIFIESMFDLIKGWYVVKEGEDSGYFARL